MSRGALTWKGQGAEWSTSLGCIEFDCYDAWHFDRMRAHAPRLSEALRANPQHLPLARDLYCFLYKPQPVPRERGPRRERAVLEMLWRHAERCRSRTRLDEYATVTALEEVFPEVIRAFDEGRRSDAARGAVQAVKDEVTRQSAANGADGAEAGRPSDGGEPAGGQRGQGEARQAFSRPEAAPHLQAAFGQAAGLPGAFAMAKGGGKAVHTALDHYEARLRALQEFDDQHGFAELPDARGRRAWRKQVRWGRRVLPVEPPWRRRGVRGERQRERDALVDQMKQAEALYQEVRRLKRSTEDRCLAEIARGEDRRLLDAAQRAVASFEKAMELMAPLLELCEQCDTWGRGRGVLSQLPLHEVLTLSRAIRDNPSIRKIAEAAGRWVETMRREKLRRESNRGCTERVDVALGGEPWRLLPSELVQLRHPQLRRLLLVRLAERRAMVAGLRGPERVGRGPVVLVVDTSGSMHGPRAVFAKALALALAMRCHQQRRPFVILTFGAPGELEEVRFRARASVWGRLRDVLALAFNGGTDFDGPISRVCDLVSEAPWSKADVVFVSDGECEASRASLKRLDAARRRTDLEVIGVLVGRGRGLDAIADSTFRLDPACAGRDPQALAIHPILQRLAGRL